MASQTLNLRLPTTLSPRNHRSLSLPSRGNPLLQNSSSLSFPISKPPPLSLIHKPPPNPLIPQNSRSSIFTSEFPYYPSNNPTLDHSISPMALPVSGSLFAGTAEAARWVWGLEPLYRSLVAAMGKWLSLYSEILMVRCWLSWFPNIPWERQPFSAFRDLCDPFLSLFRFFIPPIMGMDVSALFAFMVLGFLASLLNVPAKPTLN